MNSTVAQSQPVVKKASQASSKRIGDVRPVREVGYFITMADVQRHSDLMADHADQIAKYGTVLFA